ncbi:hypothetical protein MNBD_ALPHA02-1450 [hydrothermal vent metagenome]|uniref:Uncharacterized protein n=1 Tax=hydrothermal vent metagenome TaxID=652676 RepID=A0A3B0RYW1_9ZZZZ
MTKDKNVKQVSRLTGALLARKGSAAPTSASAFMNQQAFDRFAAPAPGGDATTSLDDTIETVKELAGRRNNTSQKEKKSRQKKSVTRGKVSARKSQSGKSSIELAERKRIAMTLRMVEEDHLKLRIFSAHTRKSCQTILSEALDIYLDENSDQVAELNIATQNG